jgi:DNA polymerase-3 subunit beta
MRFSIDKKILHFYAAAALRSTATKSTLSVLQNILIQTLPDGIVSISGTNLEQTITGTFSAPITEDGAVTVNARSFVELIGLVDGEVELFTKDNDLIIKSGKTKTKLTTISAAEFPPPPQVPDGAIEIDAKRFLKALSSVAFCASLDDARVTLNGVSIANNTLSATDGFRVASIDADFRLNDAIIPLASAKEIMTLFKDNIAFDVYIGNGRIFITDGSLTFVSQTIEGSFPDISAIVPKSTKINAKINTADLLRAIKQAQVIAREGNNCVTLEIGTDNILMTAESSETGKSEINIATTAEEPLRIAFNSMFLREGLEKCGAENIVLGCNVSNSPVKLTAENNASWVYVIMPMALN